MVWGVRATWRTSLLFVRPPRGSLSSLFLCACSPDERGGALLHRPVRVVRVGDHCGDPTRGAPPVVVPHAVCQCHAGWSVTVWLSPFAFYGAAAERRGNDSAQADRS